MTETITVYTPELKKLVLKPCPFCGSHARLYNIRKIGANFDYFVYCTFCGNRTQQGDNVIDIIGKWNKRVME